MVDISSSTRSSSSPSSARAAVQRVDVRGVLTIVASGCAGRGAGFAAAGFGESSGADGERSCLARIWRRC